MQRAASSSMSCGDMCDAADQLRGAEVRVRRRAAELSLIHRFDVQFEAIRAGFESVAPRSITVELTWSDLERRVCGVPAASVSARDSLQWFDTTDVEPALCSMFEQALLELTAQQRAHLLVFCTGQRCLPLPERIRVAPGFDRDRFPSAHTCSPISLVLHPYQSVEETRVKLVTAISHYNDFSLV